MSCSQCCYVCHTLLTQCVFIVSAFGFNACTSDEDVCATVWLLHQLCADPCRPKLSGYVHAVRQCPWSASCRPSSALRTTLYSRPDLNLGSLLSAAQLSHEPYGLAHCLVETRKSLTVDECLADFPIVLTVNFYARLDEMDAGCSKSRHTDGHR